MYTDNELYFPHHLIPALADLRGETWRALVQRVATLPECHEETLAFMAMMASLNGCVSCETDSYRAMKGCDTCTFQTLRRYKGTDDDLLALYEQSLERVQAFAASGDSLSRLIVGGSSHDY